MPKECIHFAVAERTALRLDDTRYAPCLSTARNGLLIGSIFHDALFYAVAPGSRELEGLAHVLHGARGQDTYTLIRMQARHAANSKDNVLPAALLVGLVSHLLADTIMHPMVYYFTGNYYGDDPSQRSLSRQRHRALETLMDMVACPGMIGNKAYSLRHLLAREPRLLTLGLPCGAMSRLIDRDESSTRRGIRQSLRIFSTLQTAYAIRPMAAALFAMRPYTPRALAELATLFYAPQLQSQAGFLQGDISYRHPVNGEQLNTTLDTLIDQAAAQAETVCRSLESAVFDGTDIPLPQTGPSMDTGMSGTGTQRMTHFADPPFPRLD